jgi:hypothetical protein
MQHTIVVAALAVAASAYQVKITNNCAEDAYIWSCGDSVGSMQTLPAGGEPWTEAYYSKEGGTAGPSIYISNGTSYESGTIAQLEYFWDNTNIWFDLSLINGSPFAGDGVVLGSDLTSIPYTACEPVVCAGGPGPCNMAYNTHEQLAGTHDCPPSNLEMTLCGAGSGPKGSSSPSAVAPSVPVSTPVAIPSSTYVAPVATVPAVTAPAATIPAAVSIAAPATTPAPDAGNVLLEDNNGNVHVVYATTVVTKIVSVQGSQKRDEHAHAHQARAHGNSQKFGRRHNHDHAA